MDFISNTQVQNAEMLATIGIKSIEELFHNIPDKLRLTPPLQDDGISEFEGLRLMERLASKNTFSNFDNYLGAGSYEHHLPALVGAICSKSEFLTAYTPYQPEASQGMLQIIFEFQSAMCALTGLDVSNASLYDGASACAEAALMAIRLQNRSKILVPHNVHPHYRAVMKQYLEGHGSQLITIPILSNGQIDFKQLRVLCDDSVAAILVQYPNFFGGIDAIQEVSKLTKNVGALTIISANPLVYGLYASASELGADIAVGDCQPFGIPMQYGGPYAGYITCRKELVRQLPGRIVGETVDVEGKRGFVLTLQAREQHIRREKATSNICTNQALAALASLVAILWYGKQGIPHLALTNYQRTAYLREKLQEKEIGQLFEGVPFLNEFVLKLFEPIEQVQQRCRERGIEPGVDLGRFYPEFANCLLIAVTETKSKEQLDHFKNVLFNRDRDKLT